MLRFVSDEPEGNPDAYFIAHPSTTRFTASVP
jgi:hypothetical protein